MSYRPNVAVIALHLDNDPIYRMRYDELVSVAEHNGFDKPIPDYKPWLRDLARAGVGGKISAYQDQEEFKRVSETAFFKGPAPSIWATRVTDEPSTTQHQAPQQLGGTDTNWSGRIAASKSGDREIG